MFIIFLKEETPWFGMSTDSNEQSNSLVNTDPEDKMVHWWDIPPDPATLPDVNDLFKSNDQVRCSHIELHVYYINYCWKCRVGLVIISGQCLLHWKPKLATLTDPTFDRSLLQCQQF